MKLTEDQKNSIEAFEESVKGNDVEAWNCIHNQWTRHDKNAPFFATQKYRVKPQPSYKFARKDQGLKGFKSFIYFLKWGIFSN